MANLISCLILLITFICVKQSVTGKTPVMLKQIIDEHNNNDCSWKIITNTTLKDLTIVNVKDNKFLKYIYSLNIKTLKRRFLDPALEEPNEAYIVHCNHLAECENGFDDLMKDKYWNPNAIFFVIIKTFNSGYEDFFRKLHHLYVFKLVLVLHDSIYFYDFQVSDHCSFTLNAIKKYKCDHLSSDHDSPIWVDIKGSLEERIKTPYSGCNMSVIVNAVVPFIFRQLDEHNDEPLGYEEEFIRILKRINFTNNLISYNSNLTKNGLVCENYTVSGILRSVQAGDVDYVIGATVLSHYRLQVFDYTYPHLLDDFILIVPKAGHIEKWEVMYKVFKPLVWGLIFLTFIFVALVACMLQLSVNRNWYYLDLTLLDMYGYLTNNASKKKTTFFMISWASFAWLITSFYQSNLTSIFTKPTYHKQINSLPEIISHNYKLYLSRAYYNYMKSRTELDMGGLVQESIVCNTDLESIKAVASARKRFTVTSRLSYLYFQAQFRTIGGAAMLHQVSMPYLRVFRTGLLRRGNPNLKRIRFLERHIIAFGFERRSMLTYIHMKKLKYYKFKNNQSVPLSCNDITGVYYVYICGCGISLVAFFVEIIFNKFS